MLTLYFKVMLVAYKHVYVKTWAAHSYTELDYMNSHTFNNIKGFSDNKSNIMSVLSIENTGNTVLHLYVYMQNQKMHRTRHKTHNMHAN
jgi:hypothetical protein